jgi:hypothetical protein
LIDENIFVMDMLTIEQQILVLENTIKVIEGKHGRDPDDVELRGKCIVIITHLRDHSNGIKRRVFSRCSYCLYGDGEDGFELGVAL